VGRSQDFMTTHAASSVVKQLKVLVGWP